MTACNATLTTATVEPCDHTCAFEGKSAFASDLGSVFYCTGNRHVTLHTLTCNLDASHNGHQPLPYHLSGGTNWHDDTPGATPHRQPLVTDEMEYHNDDAGSLPELLAPVLRDGVAPLDATFAVTSWLRAHPEVVRELGENSRG